MDNKKSINMDNKKSINMKILTHQLKANVLNKSRKRLASIRQSIFEVEIFNAACCFITVKPQLCGFARITMLYN